MMMEQNAEWREKLEDVQKHHAKEKDDLQRRIGQMNRTIEQKKMKLKQAQHQLTKAACLVEDCAHLEARSKQLREGMEERKRAAGAIADSFFKAGHHLAALLCSLEPELECPIMRYLPKDPVLAADGFTYDRSAIKRWVHEREKAGWSKINSPMTGKPLAHYELTTNYVVRKIINQHSEWDALSQSVCDDVGKATA